MGFFGKKKKQSNMIKEPYGMFPRFTTAEELPDDLPTLRAMGHYYTYNPMEKNRQNAFYIDKKIIELDKEKKYGDSRYRMAICYFDGFMVDRDTRTGSRYFIEWMDGRLLNGSLSSVTNSVREYFNWGFRSYQYLVEMADKRIALDLKNGGEPVGMCMYKSFFELWKYSSLVQMLGIGNLNASKYLYFLQKNFYIPDVELMVEIMENRQQSTVYGYKNEDAYKRVSAAAEQGNLWAVSYIMNKWVDKPWEKNKTKDAELAERKKEYDQLCAEYKKLQQTHSHQENIRKKEAFDAELMKHAEFFTGQRCYLPENWPFPDRDNSLYQNMSKLLSAYNALYQMSRTDDDWRKNPRTKQLRETVEKYGQILIKEEYAPAMFLMLLADVNMLIMSLPFESRETAYKKLVERNYEPAIKLQTEVDDETRKLALMLRVNSKAMAEKAESSLAEAREYGLSGDWAGALYSLSAAAKYDAEIPIKLKKSILYNAVKKALAAYKNKDKNVDYEAMFRIAARDFHEPEAYFQLAVIEHNENRNIYIARDYCQKVIQYAGYSYLTDGPLRESVLREAKENLEIIYKNIRNREESL